MNFIYCDIQFVVIVKIFSQIHVYVNKRMGGIPAACSFQLKRKWTWNNGQTALKSFHHLFPFPFLFFCPNNRLCAMFSSRLSCRGALCDSRDNKLPQFLQTCLSVGCLSVIQTRLKSRFLQPETTNFCGMWSVPFFFNPRHLFCASLCEIIFLFMSAYTKQLFTANRTPAACICPTYLLFFIFHINLLTPRIDHSILPSKEMFGGILRLLLWFPAQEGTETN